MQKKEHTVGAADLLLYLFNNKWPIIGLTAAAAIVSIIVALVLPNEYQSSVILFPASSTSISKELLTDVTRTRKQILQFGEEEEVEQLLQILHSNELQEHIIGKFQLMKHYDIDPSSAYPYTQLVEQYSSNVNYRRTQFMSIEISVLDKDPKTAAAIANEITSRLDTVYNRMQKERALEAFKIVEREYKKLNREIRLMEDSLEQIRGHGIYDYQAQAVAYSQALAMAIERGNSAGVQKMEKQLQVLKEYGGAYNSVSSFLEKARERSSILESKLAEARVDYEQNLPHKFVVNPAYVPERKSKPVRWLIVSISTISGFFMALVLLLIRDTVRKIDFKSGQIREN